MEVKYTNPYTNTPMTGDLFEVIKYMPCTCCGL